MEKNVNRRGRRDKESRRRKANQVVFVIAVLMFFFSGWQLFKILKEYKAGDTEYNELQTVVLQETEREEEKVEPTEVSRFTVDFDKLLEINKDTVAWLRFDEPAIISYPVVMSEDNHDYLYTTFEGKSNKAGTLFVDYRCSGSFDAKNTFIHGHNMKNGSMFGRLRKYRSQEFWAENPYFYIYLPDGREVKYEIFATCIVQDSSDTYTMSFGSTEEFQDYIKYVKDHAIYNTGVEVPENGKLVSLSTCTSVNDHERLVVHGVKVSERIAGE